MSWRQLAEANKSLAEFGEGRLASRVAYLATIRKDGSPRVHPVTPFLANGDLFVGMYSHSPKGHDLARDPRYAIHCSVDDDEGGGGEFAFSGRAHLVHDPQERALASRSAPYELLDTHVLFRLQVERAITTTYAGDETRRERWVSPR